MNGVWRRDQSVRASDFALGSWFWVIIPRVPPVKSRRQTELAQDFLNDQDKRITREDFIVVLVVRRA